MCVFICRITREIICEFQKWQAFPCIFWLGKTAVFRCPLLQGGACSISAFAESGITYPNRVQISYFLVYTHINTLILLGFQTKPGETRPTWSTSRCKTGGTTFSRICKSRMSSLTRRQGRTKILRPLFSLTKSVLWQKSGLSTAVRHCLGAEIDL